jgi:Kef-type K+ transport system membrane component KefB
MSYARKNKKNVFGSVVGVIVLAAIAIWQFYLFVTFQAAGGNSLGQNGTHHLWWALALTVLAFGAAFLVFSVFLRHDSDDDLHITSAPRARI